MNASFYLAVNDEELDEIREHGFWDFSGECFFDNQDLQGLPLRRRPEDAYDADILPCLLEITVSLTEEEIARYRATHHVGEDWFEVWWLPAEIVNRGAFRELQRDISDADVRREVQRQWAIASEWLSDEALGGDLARAKADQARLTERDLRRWRPEGYEPEGCDGGTA